MVCGREFTTNCGQKFASKQTNINIQRQARLDSQSVKTTSVSGEEHGFDAGKQVKGRKRHILVDTIGLLLAVLVTSAAVQEGDGAKMLLKRLNCSCKKPPPNMG